MGSEAGLIRFDNKELKVYGNDNIPGLLDERIHDMKLDRAGNVYAKNVHYQPISTAAKGKHWSPKPQVFRGANDFYFPTWGYLSRNPLIGRL